MKQICVTKIGSLREPDENKRGQVEVLQVPEPEMGAEDVKIKVAYCAICGSDPHLAEGIFGWDPPFGIGHEISGVIVALGERASQKGLKVGDRVAGNFLGFCGKCYYCQNGQQQFCPYSEEYNSPGMSEYIVWHESQVYKLPDDVDLKTGCMLEPISIAVRIADKVQAKTGMRVAICGGGPIGLLTVQAMKMMGCVALTVIEPVESRRRIAQGYGAEYNIDPLSENINAESDRITGGLGFDVVIDCSGSVHAVAGLPEITAKGGTLLYAAMYPGDYEMPLNLFKYCYANELTISGVFIAPYTYPRAIQVMKRFSLDEFTKKVFLIDQAEDAFKAQISGEYTKILINCNKDLATN
ncbi:alcohol dehydrogenase catalytic domain-containing protein [Marispirochaeta sp.]|jgi:threonine dehydrogenase-like Zn-dependent dehydrogenase|uniref:zinc-dependent alcohol dehydrogenase n=1 Tax=Marispirochaeta sp. TaxID=2038653 RepID=UPI0029C614BF|nr:alcohol dehydrogenase catalytic domain-containing protein [Marispirochaeta sp.]